MTIQSRKQLEFELKEITKSIPLLKEKVSISQRELNLAEKRQVELTAMFNKDSTGPTMSDHAVLRYLERKFNLDIDKIRNKILTPNVITAINQGATSIKSSGFDLKIKNKVITTCY